MWLHKCGNLNHTNSWNLEYFAIFTSFPSFDFTNRNHKSTIYHKFALHNFFSSNEGINETKHILFQPLTSIKRPCYIKLESLLIVIRNCMRVKDVANFGLQVACEDFFATSGKQRSAYMHNSLIPQSNLKY